MLKKKVYDLHDTRNLSFSLKVGKRGKKVQLLTAETFSVQKPFNCGLNYDLSEAQILTKGCNIQSIFSKSKQQIQ